MITTLLDLGWQPLAPHRWSNPDGEEFDLLSGDRDRLLHFALEGALEQAAWARAAAHHLGAGPQGGVDLTVMKRHLAALRRKSRHGEVAVLQMLATGGLWPAARRFGSEAASSLFVRPARAHIISSWFSRVHSTRPACAHIISS